MSTCAALQYYDRAAETAAPIERRLRAEMERVLGADWCRSWFEGLPEYLDVPGQINVLEILRLWTYANSLDLVEWGKMRYNLLGQGDHWFPGENARAVDEPRLRSALQRSPFRDKIPALLRQAHALFFLSPEQLEEIRLLSNAELDSASPFAAILLGQPTLATRLRQGVFAALDQRISVRYTIAGMDLAESIGYLRHHLTHAGRADPLIADDAAARLHRYANGLPRALNNAATAALMAAAADGKSLVDDTCAKKAIAELTRT